MVVLRWLAGSSRSRARQAVGVVATPGTAMLGREPCESWERGGAGEFGGLDCNVYYTPAAREADIEVWGRFEGFQRGTSRIWRERA